MPASSVEQICDGMIRLIQKNVVARTPLTQDILVGQGVVTVDDTFRFEDSNEVMLVDNTGLTEYHTILKKLDTNHLQLLQPVQNDFLMANGSVVQKAVGWVPLFEDGVLFGDREVIPTISATVTVEPTTMSNEWMWLQGGLSQEFRLQIMVYLKLDETERSQRAVLKYADNIYRLTTGSVHLDVVMDEQHLASDLAAGTNIVPLPTIDGWPADNEPRYEVQDNNHVEIDFRIAAALSGPPRVQLNRNLINSYRVADKLKFRRRVIYIYDSRVDSIEYGTISKNSTMFKAAKLSWFGKETEEWEFPQQGRG